MPHHLVVDRLAGQHEFMSNAVGLDKMRAEGDEHFSNNRFARGDAAGKADFQHRFRG